METNNKQKIIPNLWFDTQAEEAARFYTSLFENSRIGHISRYGKEGFELHGKPAGSVMALEFELEGYKFAALNGGPQFKLNPSVSFFVTCETEAETDTLWKNLTEKGAVLMPLDKYPWSEKYGFAQDRYGLAWQISFGKISDVGQKIAPCLLFVNKYMGKAEAALRQYTKIFTPSDVDSILKYGPGEEAPEGTVKHAQFSLMGEKFMVMDGPGEHNYGFNEAVSFIVSCKDQKEIDYYWDQLREGGDEKAQVCGWLKDRFGLSWQVVPDVLYQMLGGDDTERTSRVTRAVWQMKKLDIAKLKEAYGYDEHRV